MDMEENTLQFSFKYLSEPKKYYRYSDHATVKARLVRIDGKKLMQILEKPSETRVCPGCSLLLSIRVGRRLGLRTYLEPAEFHKRHRPMVDKG